MLCDAVMREPYFNYLMEKFNWTDPPGKVIYWPTICITLKHFKANKQQTIQKFIQDRYQVQSSSTEQLCPSCHQAVETADHFLACPHLGQQQIWKELHELLYQHQQKMQSAIYFMKCLHMAFTKAIKPQHISTLTTFLTIYTHCTLPKNSLAGATVLWLHHTTVAGSTRTVPSTDKQY